MILPRRDEYGGAAAPYAGAGRARLGPVQQVACFPSMLLQGYRRYKKTHSPGGGRCGDRVLDGPASGEEGSKGKN